jgi:hypothetical protein
MATSPDTYLIASPEFNPVAAGAVLITVNGVQTTLAALLAVSTGANMLAVTGVTANGALGTLPANAFPLYAFLRETAGIGVNVGIGSTSGGADVVAATAVPASGTLTIPITSFLKDWFSATAAQGLFLSSASWGGASINATLVYGKGN